MGRVTRMLKASKDNKRAELPVEALSAHIQAHPELVKVISGWERLPEHVKHAILTLAVPLKDK